MNELISSLVGQLGVGEDQAKGGAGLLFKLAQQKLGGDEFGKLNSALGGGVGELIGAAPQEEEGGLGSLLGGLGKMMGGGGQVGNLISLAGGFSKLGLDEGMIGRFIPIVMQFVQSKGGPELVPLLQKALGG